MRKTLERDIDSVDCMHTLERQDKIKMTTVPLNQVFITKKTTVTSLSPTHIPDWTLDLKDKR